MEPATDQTEASGDLLARALCRRCNYPLRGLTQPCCPECGAPFDPHDPSTMNLGRAMGPLARLWLRPMGWPSLLAVSLFCLWPLWEGRHPRFYYLPQFLMLPLMWLACLMFWVTRSAIADWYRQPAGVRHRDWKLLTIPLLATPLLLFQVPLRLAFLSAKPGLERLVQQSGPAGQPTFAHDQQAGLFTISATQSHRWFRSRGARGSEPDPSRQFFLLADDADCAFIYSTSGIDDIPYNPGSKGHLMGNWYWMAQD